MKNSQIQDERILAEKRKIQSKGYGFIIYILLISVIVQQFLLVAPFKQYAVEFILLIGCGLYNIISYNMKGINTWNMEGNSKIKILRSALFSGICSVILYAVLSGQNDFVDLVIYYVVFVIFFFGLEMTVTTLNSKKQKSIDKRINDDDIETK